MNAARSRPLTLLLLPLALLILALGVQGLRSLERAESELQRAQRNLVASEASTAAAAPLRAGIARIGSERLLLLGALGASLLALLATAVLLRRQQQRLLGAEAETLEGSLRALAEGQAPPPAVMAPEGSLRAQLQACHVAVWERSEQVRERIGELQQIRDALDRTATNVLIADRDNRIVYVNQSLLQTMTAAEADLRTQLPRFAASRLLGGPVEMLLVDPERQGKILRELTTSHHVLMEVGRRHFDVTVTPLRGEGGERTGFVAEWRERTAEALVEQELSTVVNAAVDGDFSRRIALEGKEGFQYQIGRSINRLLKTADLGFREVERVLRALAHGDLTQSVAGEFKGTFAELGQLANATIGELRSIVAQIQDATEAINSAAREIVRGSSDLSDRTQQQSDRLQGTSTAVEQLTATVRQNAAHAGQANQLAIGASDIAQRGGAVVSEVVRTMNGIDAASRKIVDIISVIDGIAFQTNILALNAAVEAARAGEQGRGFAVVAAEVRNLAKRSAGAAREIKALIGDSVNEVASGARLVEQAGSTMAEIVDSVQRVTSIMAEITAASEAQSRGIEQVSRNIADMDGSTQQNAVLVEETTATAHLLEAQLDRLAASVARFELGGERRRRAGDHLEIEAPSPVPAEPAPRSAERPAPAAPARQASPATVRRPALTAAPGRQRAAPPQGHRDDDGWVEF